MRATRYFKRVNYNKLIRRFLSYGDSISTALKGSLVPSVYPSESREAVRVKATIIILFARLFL